METIANINNQNMDNQKIQHGTSSIFHYDDIFVNDNRTNNDEFRYDRTTEYETDPSKENDVHIINIFRFKFKDDFMKELYNFSKIHQYDERKSFKEAWEKWVEENDEIVNIEINRLKDLGYNGNIIDKMFKSARYYFRNKKTVKLDPVKRRKYVNVQKKTLDIIDNHILTNVKNPNFKPSNSFDDFCKEKIDILTEEINYLYKNGITVPLDIKNKIKKTYKNRYFMIICK